MFGKNISKVETITGLSQPDKCFVILFPASHNTCGTNLIGNNLQ